jgi:hypothetical protein
VSTAARVAVGAALAAAARVHLALAGIGVAVDLLVRTLREGAP